MLSSLGFIGMGDSPVRSKMAGLPVKRWYLSHITSQHGISSSIKNALRPVCSAPIMVDMLPPKRSSTFWPRSGEYWIHRTASSAGLPVKCSSCCGGIFVTRHCISEQSFSQTLPCLIPRYGGSSSSYPRRYPQTTWSCQSAGATFCVDRCA